MTHNSRIIILCHTCSLFCFRCLFSCCWQYVSMPSLVGSVEASVEASEGLGLELVEVMVDWAVVMDGDGTADGTAVKWLRLNQSWISYHTYIYRTWSVNLFICLKRSNSINVLATFLWACYYSCQGHCSIYKQNLIKILIQFKCSDKNKLSFQFSLSLCYPLYIPQSKCLDHIISWASKIHAYIPHLLWNKKISYYIRRLYTDPMPNLIYTVHNLTP